MVWRGGRGVGVWVLRRGLLRACFLGRGMGCCHLHLRRSICVVSVRYEAVFVASAVVGS